VIIGILLLIMSIVLGWQYSEKTWNAERIQQGDTEVISRHIGNRVEDVIIDRVQMSDDNATLSVRFRSKKLEIRDRRYSAKSRRKFQILGHQLNTINLIYAGFEVVPQAKTLVVSAYDEMVDDKGWPHHECIISVKAAREIAESINPDNLVPTQVFSHFEYRDNIEDFSTTFKPVRPFDELQDDMPKAPSSRDKEIIRLFSSLKENVADEAQGVRETMLATGMEDFLEMMKYELSNRRVEYSVVGFFDQDKKLITWQEVKGHTVWVGINIDSVVQAALACQAKYVANLHNHPVPGDISPMLEPSDADFESAFAFYDACLKNGLELYGSWIVSKREIREYFYSTCQRLHISLDEEQHQERIVDDIVDAVTNSPQ